MVGLEEPSLEYRVDALQRLVQGGRWRVEAMRAYSRPLLLWFTRGGGRVTVAGKTRGYGPHNAVFLPAGTMHGFDMLGHVYGMAVFFPRSKDLGLPTEPIHLRIRDTQSQMELTGLIDGLDREIARDLPGRNRALDAQAGLLSVWLERHRDIAEGPHADEKLPAGDQLAYAFTALLERDFRTGKGVSDYAKDLGITPTHLTRVCKQACGRSASRLVQDRVHYEARRLLSETRIPINQVAKSLGFKSAAYFTRAFQTNTGTTPSDFRRKS